MIRAATLCLLLFCCRLTGYSQDSVKPGPRGKIKLSAIIITGDKTTRSSVILREIGFKTGDMIPLDSIDTYTEDTRLKLFNLSVFNEVAQRTEITDSGLYWYIHVRERWFIIPTAIVQYADRNFNTWWVSRHHDLRRVSAGVTLTDKNFRGNLENLSVTAEAGFTRKLGISYTRPYVNSGQTHGLGFFADITQSSETYYTTDLNKLVYAGAYNGPAISRQVEGGVSYLYRPAYASRHIFQLSYKDFWVGDTVVKLNPEYYLNGHNKARFLELSYRFEYNGVDNWNYSLTGDKLIATGIVRQGLEGLGFQSFANVEAGYFRSPLPRWYTSVVFRGRIMLPGDQPYYFRGGLGTQTDYVRGYEYYVIDGANYGLLRLDLKRELFNKTYSLPIRYFTAVPLRVYPKIFADAGYINSPSPGNSFLSNGLLYSVGAGVDIVSLYDVKVRLEFAYNHLRQNGLYLHFNSE